MEKKSPKKPSKHTGRKPPNLGHYNPDLKVDYVSIKQAAQELTPGTFRAWILMHLAPEVFHGRKKLGEQVFMSCDSVADRYITMLRLRGYLWVSEPGRGKAKTVFKLVKRAIIPRKNLFLMIAPDQMSKKLESA